MRGDQFRRDNPRIIYPPQLALTTNSELQELKDMFQIQSVKELVTAISTHKIDMNVDTLTKLYPLVPPPTRQIQWTIPVLIGIIALSRMRESF